MSIQLVSTPEGFVELQTELTRISSEAPPPVDVNPARVYGGAVTYNAANPSNVEQREQARFQVSHDGVPGGSVLASRQRVNGRDTVELVPGVPGSRTDIKTALRDGLIVETSPGFYQDAGDQQATIQKALDPFDDTPQEDPGAGIFDVEEDAAWQQHIDPLPQHSFDHALASGVAVAALGMGTLEDTAKGLAKSAALELPQATALVEAGAGVYQRAADRSVAGLGITGDALDAFYADCKTKPRHLQDAVQRLIHTRDASGFKQMAIAWAGANPDKLPEVQAMKAAGFETFVDRKSGEVMVRQGQGQWRPARQVLGR